MWVYQTAVRLNCCAFSRHIYLSLFLWTCRTWCTKRLKAFYPQDGKHFVKLWLKCKRVTFSLRSNKRKRFASHCCSPLRMSEFTWSMINSEESSILQRTLSWVHMNWTELLISQDTYTKLFLKAISAVVIDDTLVCNLLLNPHDPEDERSVFMERSCKSLFCWQTSFMTW